MFQSEADKRMTKVILLLEFILAMGLAFWLNAFLAGAMLAAMLISYVWYHRMSKKMFGGITGDLAGWFLQVCECMMAGFVLLAGYLVCL